MELVGIGTDIVKLSRIKALYDQWGARFLLRILSSHEREALASLSHKIPYIAKRFAAKEAVAKALGTGIGEKAAFVEISIENETSGKPKVVLYGKAKEFATSVGVGKVHISLSDEREYAIAYVILESA